MSLYRITNEDEKMKTFQYSLPPQPESGYIPSISDLDMSNWYESGLLNRLIDLKSETEGVSPERLVIASFEMEPYDDIRVCEADWLRKYFEGRVDYQEAQDMISRSEVPIDDYQGEFNLPGFKVMSPVEFNRIELENIARWKKVNGPWVVKVSKEELEKKIGK